VSVLLRPGLVPDELHLCTVAVALAAADACAAVAGLEPELKWPNDLMVGERKLAGILAEIVPAGPGAGAGPGRSATAVVVGLGLNVQWPPPDAAPLPDASPPPDAGRPGGDLLDVATSLGRETGSTVDATAVLDAVLVALEPRLVDLGSADGRRRLAGDYRRRCATLGRTVRVTGHDESFTGVATDITVAGHLMVDVGTCLRTVTAGDVVHLRTQA
jgi:BirA family biotin operon repressor/biotin-[acetyl-CoA-carboxylase] ligase